jgi:hypothetical protein
MPKQRKFPVCPKCTGVCSCKADCQGLRAARIRAAQYHYTQVKEAAERMMVQQGCPGLSEGVRRKYKKVGGGKKKAVAKKKKPTVHRYRRDV